MERSRPAFIGHRKSSCGATGFRLGQKMAATNRCLARTNKSRTATKPTKKRSGSAVQFRAPMAVYVMKPFAPLAVAALALGVWAWHVAPDYVSPPAAPLPLAFTSSSPRAAEADSCRCHGCGCKGGPGWRGQNGQCVSHANLTKDCGLPPSTRCTYEGAQQICPSRG